MLGMTMILGSQGISGSAVPLWVLPGASVDMYFANSLYYGGTLANLLSTSRASNGYAQDLSGNLINFSNNVPRITNQGLLIEEARTNVCLQSQTFDSATWVKAAQGTGSTPVVTANTATAPDGTLTADNLVGTVTTGVGNRSRLTQALTTLASTTYSVSVWVQAVSGTQPFTLGIVGNVSTSIKNHLTIGTAWQLVTATFTTAVAETAITLNLGMYDEVSATSTNVNIWGAQFEPGSFPTSYIPTTTAIATRAADNIQAAGNLASVLGAAPGSSWAQTFDIAQPSIVAGQTSTSNTFLAPNGASTARVSAAGVDITATLGSGSWQSGAVKVASGWSGSGVSIAGNNGTVATSANVMTFTPPFYLGSNKAANFFIDGYIQRFTAWNSRLPDATLKALTQ